MIIDQTRTSRAGRYTPVVYRPDLVARARAQLPLRFETVKARRIDGRDYVSGFHRGRLRMYSLASDGIWEVIA